MKRASIYKGFLILVISSSFLKYFLGGAAIPYGLLLISILSIIFSELITPRSLKLRDWALVYALIPYSFLALLYYFISPYKGEYFNSYSLVFISIPFITLTIIRLRCILGVQHSDDFLFKLIYLFLFFQFFICIGQMSTYVFGVGFPVSDLYSGRFMLNGSFVNSNNLASIVLLISFLFINCEKRRNISEQILAWSLIMSLLILTGSRSAIVFTVFIIIFNGRLRLKKLLLCLGLGGLSLIAYAFVSYFSDLSVIERILHRLDSFSVIFYGGLQADSSIALRLNSYVHFLSSLPDLGFGSGKINNYFKYSENSIFKSELMFTNPHSLFVEIGYWLGWPGLITFCGGLLYLVRYLNSRILCLIVIAISSSIPSSVLGELMFYYFMILVLLVSNERYLENSFAH